MNITEESIPITVDRNLLGSSREGAEMVGVSTGSSASEILEAINGFVSAPPKKKLFSKVNNWDDRALPLGALWGEQLVREFDWEWTSVTFHDQGDSKAVGVVSSDRSLVVYPFHFIFGCLENKAPVTIMLAFNMLRGGEVPAFEPRGFENLMECVHHIVPPA